MPEGYQPLPVDMSGFHMHDLRFYFAGAAGYGTVTILLQAQVLDRATGKGTPLNLTRTMDARLWHGMHLLVRRDYLRGMVTEMVAHEVLETMKVDGIEWQDPHSHVNKPDVDLAHNDPRSGYQGEATWPGPKAPRPTPLAIVDEAYSTPLRLSDLPLQQYDRGYDLIVKDRRSTLSEDERSAFKERLFRPVYGLPAAAQFAPLAVIPAETPAGQGPSQGPTRRR